RTVNIGGDKQRLTVLRFEEICELGGKSRFTGTLQSADHDDGRRLRGKANVLRSLAHDEDEFVIQDLDELLLWIYRSQDIGAERLGLHIIDEFFGDLVIDVGVQQGAAKIAGNI